MDVCVCVCLQEGETPLHLAAELEKKRTHSQFEDTDIISLLLKHEGDMNIQTKFVSSSSSLENQIDFSVI